MIDLKKIAKQALGEREQLTLQEELDILRLLVQALKRIPDLEQAKKYFYEYRKLEQQGQSNE